MKPLHLFPVDHGARPRDVHDEHRDVCRMMGSDRASGGWLYAVTSRGLWIRGDVPLGATPPRWCRTAAPLTHAATADCSTGDVMAFFAVVNPIRSDFVAGARGKRRSIEPAEWITGKLPKIGAAVVEVTATQAMSRGRRNDSEITLMRAVCSGLLRVVDGRALEEAIDAGIGSAKGYGCGLMALGVGP